MSIEKSITELAWNVTEAEYRADDAISYSSLSSFAREGAEVIPHLKEKKDAEALRFGSLVDTLMTEPEELDVKFLISDTPRPSDTVAKIVTNIWENSDKTTNDITNIKSDTILLYANDAAYYTNWKDETRVNKLVSEGMSFFELLGLAEGKTLMSQDDYQRALSCVEQLKTNSFTSTYFYDNPFTLGKIEGHFQLKFKLNFKIDEKPYSIRCMFDRIIVDHDAKTIQPIDLKTTGKSEEIFPQSFVTWNYYLQATMYSFILKTLCSRDPYFKDFTILPFLFIVINRFRQKPLVWKFEEKPNSAYYLMIEGKKVDGWFTLLTNFVWHVENNEFMYSKASYEGNGLRNIEL